VDPPVAGTRSERSAPGALVRWVLRCTVLTGLLVGGWLIGGTTALAGPLDPEIPLGTGSAPLTAPGPEAADLLDAVGTAGGESPAVLDTHTGSTGLPEIAVTVVEGTALPEIVDTVVGVTQPLLPPAVSDETLPEVMDPPPIQGEPDPVSEPAPAPAPLAVPAAAPAPVVSGPVAVTPVPTAPAAEPAAAARPGSVPDGPRTPDPDGDRSAPPCSTGSSTGSGAASGPAVVGESLAGPARPALRRGPPRTGTARPRGLPQRPSTSPD
jgi:hypothetical protein